MFGRRVRPQLIELYEARIADLKEAHERQVEEMRKTAVMLVEQIEYLRMTVPAPLRIVGPDTVEHRGPMAPSQYMTEEEEDVRAMADNGLIDAGELEAALADLGINTE